MDGKSAIAAESRPRKGPGARRSSAEVPSTAAEVRMTAEMPSATTTEMRMAATATEMPAAAMPTTAVTAATMTAAAFRRGIARD